MGVASVLLAAIGNGGNVTAMGRLETLAKTRPRAPHVQGYESRPGFRVEMDVLM